jgi:hypothetical protein
MLWIRQNLLFVRDLCLCLRIGIEAASIVGLLVLPVPYLDTTCFEKSFVNVAAVF